MSHFTILGYTAEDYQANGDRANRLFVAFDHAGPKAAAFTKAQELLQVRAGGVPCYVIQFRKRHNGPQPNRRDRIREMHL